MIFDVRFLHIELTTGKFQKHMKTITTEEIKALRDKTGISVMQCKKALEEAGGDAEKALAVLRRKGGEFAAKKSERTLGAGIVASYVHGTRKIGAMVELSCESDFVAKNDEFEALAYDIAMHIAASNPSFVSAGDIGAKEKSEAQALFTGEVEKSGKPEEIRKKMLEGKLSAYFAERTLLEQPFVKNPEVNIKGLIDGAIQKFGERIEVRRFVRFSSLDRS